jgi:phage repressor protein C with HTH and peptisase S24 domain
MITLSERAAILLDLAGGSVTHLAELAGIRPPSVSDWLNGKTKTIKGSPAARLAKHFSINMLWLTDGIGPMRRNDLPEPVHLTDHPDLQEIPRVRFKLSAGVSGYAIEPENGNGKPVFFRKDWFDLHNYRPDQLFAVRVAGASMEPALYDGDLIVVNTADTAPHDGDVFAINFEGELVIKRLRRDAGEWWATSDAADQRRFAPKRCTEDVKIIGRVVYKQSERI